MLSRWCTSFPLSFQHTSDPSTEQQGLTLVHSSAQLERFFWDRGCA